MSRNLPPKLRVECYAGQHDVDEPRCFYLEERKISVATLLDRWLAQEYHYFKVRGDDGGIYILRHTLGDDWWEMMLYDSGTRDNNRLSSS